MTANVQNFARQKQIPVDTVQFGHKLLREEPDQLKSKPASGCYIYGLYLEGARWDAKTGSLEESRQKELFTGMAAFYLKPKAERIKPTTGIYNCPCYKTLTRAGLLSTTGHSTNFVLPLRCPTDRDQSFWLKRGAAMLCATND